MGSTKVATATMKFSLTLLFIFCFIAFIAAAPAEDAPVKEPSEPKEDEEILEAPESPDDEQEKEDEGDAKLEDVALKETKQDEDEEPALEEGQENDVEDPKKKPGRRCDKGGFRWKVTCKGKGRKKKCHKCCTKCKFAHRCRRVRKYKRPVCFVYWKKVCKGRHRIRARMCLKAHYTCFIYGRCWARRCHKVRPKRRG